MKPAADSPQRFHGFADPKFFRRLARNQSRDWFASHKDEYTDGFARPMAALMGELAPALQRAYPDCDLGDPKVFRIHRDVRFSKDKSPYKTHIAGVVPVKSGSSAVFQTPAAIYFHLGCDAAGKTDERYTGAGLYFMEPGQLARYRAAALEPKRGGELQRIVAKLRRLKVTFGAAETLKKPPKSVVPEHPLAELLMMKGLVAGFEDVPAALVRKRALLPWLIERGKAVAPLVRWLTYAAR